MRTRDGHAAAMRTRAPAQPGWAGPIGLRTPATALLAIAILLPLALMTLGAWVAWRTAWTRAAWQIEQSAESIAEYGQRVLTLHALAAGRMDAVLRGLSDGEIRAREHELHTDFRLILDEIPGTDAGFVIGRYGSLLASANLFPVPRGDIAHRDFFQALAAEDAPDVHVSAVSTGRTTGRLFFAVSRRRTQTGNHDLPPGAFDGLVYVAIYPETLAASLRRLVDETAEIGVLVRVDGEILGRSAGQAGPRRLMTRFSEATGGLPDRTGYEAVSEVDGVARLYAGRRIEGWPVYAVAARSRAAIVASWRREVGSQLAIGIPAMLALCLMALTVHRAQSRLAASNAELEMRVRARTADLAASEALLQGTLEAAQAFAFAWDAASDRVTRSPNAARILGLSPARAVAGTRSAFLDAVHPDDQPAARAATAGLTPARPDYAVRYRVRRPDGRTVWLQTNGTGAFGADGGLVEVTGLTRDVTAEVEAERARRDSAARLRAATEGAGLGIYEIDFARNAAWFDARAAAICGDLVPAEAWVPLDGPDWAALAAAIHPEDRPAFEAAWQGVVAGRAEGWAVETRLRRPDGPWISDWCHGVVLEREAGTGRPLSLVGIVQDVTARRRLEADLRQGQKLQALGELAGGIAHDFNNVLQAVSGAATALGRDVRDDAAVQRRVRLLAEAVARGAAITGRLLDFARRGELRLEPLEPHALLVGLKEILDATLGPRVAVRIEAEPGLPRFQADREQVQTALINLATNARDAMPEGGTLTFAAVAEEVVVPGAAGRPAELRPGGYVRITVRDTGVGMDSATLAQVTEPFFTTKPQGLGTGLGLPMVKALAERLRGAFAIESAPGRGTAVMLWFPREPERAEPPQAGDGAAAPAIPPMRVLVVDDEPLVREMLTEELEAAGCSVLAAPDAAGALALLDAGAAVDALVTDLAMPGLDGMALIGAARIRRPGLPCVLVTGLPEGGPALPRCPGGGRCAVLRKPVSGAGIAACLGGLVGAA